MCNCGGCKKVVNLPLVVYKGEWWHGMCLIHHLSTLGDEKVVYFVKTGNTYEGRVWRRV